jgi:soluble lytic murein transglycosylase-like protein
MGLFLPLTPASAEIRGFVDAKGFFRFPGLRQSSPAKTGERPASAASYDRIIREVSGIYRVDSGLVKAVIRAESAFNPSAVSHKGALGLMQLMPSTASLMEVADPFDPVENVHGGTKYLALLLRRFNGDKALALAAYNAGPEKVDLYKGVPPYAETRMYVRKVMEFYSAYRRD